jgi:hypothetical protein
VPLAWAGVFALGPVCQPAIAVPGRVSASFSDVQDAGCALPYVAGALSNQGAAIAGNPVHRRKVAIAIGFRQKH